MNKSILPFILIFFYFFNAVCTYGQEVSVPIQTQFQSDSISGPEDFIFSLNSSEDEFLGEIIRGTVDSIWINVSGEVKVYGVTEIRSINLHNYKGEYTFMDRNNSRHILAPTAMSLEKGEAYYQNLLLAGNVLSYGVNERFSLTGGALVPAIVNEGLVLYFAPKVSYKIDKDVHLGVGVAMGADLDSDDLDIYELFIVPFVNTTFGNKDSNVTFGLGYGLEDDDLENNVLAAMFGFNYRLGERFVISSENTLARVNDAFPDNYYFGGHVLRILKRKNTFEVGLLTLNIDGFFAPLPFFGYIRTF